MWSNYTYIYLLSGWAKQSPLEERPIPMCADNARYCETPAKIECVEYSCEPLSIDRDSVETGNPSLLFYFP